MTKRIFVCDDDPDIIEMLEIVLEDAELEVISETDSRKACKRILEAAPDLVLMDLWMPVVSGDMVLHEIRSSDFKSLPVIIMSASRDGRYIAMNAGADDYLPKPFDIHDLVERINKLT